LRTVIDLNGEWAFRMLPTDKHHAGEQHTSSVPDPAPPTSSGSHFLRAHVPGCVHLDLFRAGLIPDPFFGTNEHEVRWVHEQDWLYRKRFDVGPDVLSRERVDLVFEGVDTFADIALNGKRVGSTNDMFVPWCFDVKDFLRKGENELEVTFHSATAESMKLAEKCGELRGPYDDPRCVHTRKAHYSYGWDWAPRLPTCGVWRNVRLEAWDSARLSGVRYETSLAEGAAALRLHIEIQSTAPQTLRVAASLSRNGVTAQSRTDVEVTPGSNEAHLEMVIENPDLWWPNGMGEPALYSLHVTLEHDTHSLDELAANVGLRTVTLLERDEQDNPCFIFEINGRKVFCKGANWVPADSFLPRITPETYDALVSMARDANMNMLRVWGGGIYEDEAFYNACDRHGIMVWQDFMFSCGEYPEADDFLQTVKREAELAVSRLRPHPSVVVWCGNNECLWNVCGPKASGCSGSGESIYYKILPEVCSRLDGTRPYWPGSPASTRDTTEDPDRCDIGDQHLWSVWSGWLDYSAYARFDGTFLSEFGMQAPPHIKTIASFTHQADRHPQSLTLEHHNKQNEGPERIFRFLAGHFNVPSNLADFVYVAQLNQAEALKCGVEHWRKNMYRTAGALFWQLNDCWPVVSWSVIDYYLRPKAAYYYARRFFAPVILVIEREGDAIGISTVSDRRDPFKARLEVRHISTRGEELSTSSHDIEVPHGTRLSAEIQCTLVRPGEELIAARLLERGHPIAQETLLFAEPKHLDLPPAQISWRLVEDTEGPPTLTLSASRFAKAVRLDIHGLDARFSDNYFDLVPGWEKSVQLHLPPGTALNNLRGGLSIIHLGLID